MTIWIIIIICLLPIFFFTKFTKRFRNKYPDMFGYIFSLIGTFIGVFVGLYVSTIEEKNDRRDQTISVLQSGKKEIQWLMQRADAFSKAPDTLNTREMIQLRGLESPPFFTLTLRSELMAEMLQPHSIAQFNRIKDKMFFYIEVSVQENTKERKEDFKNDLDDYKNQLSLTLTVIDEEIERLKGNISTKKFEENASKRLDSFSIAN